MAPDERLIAPSAEVTERGPGVRFVVVRDGRSVPAFVVRFDGVAHAYLNVCAHQAVELDWEEGAFFDEAREHLVCATHGALYHPATGHCVAGPCRGRALTRVAVVERDGEVRVGADG